MPVQEQILDLYVGLLAARNRRMQTQAAFDAGFRLNVSGAEWERIAAEQRGALCEYHRLGMEWLALVGLKPISGGGRIAFDGQIVAYDPPIFEECRPTGFAS